MAFACEKFILLLIGLLFTLFLYEFSSLVAEASRLLPEPSAPAVTPTEFTAPVFRCNPARGSNATCARTKNALVPLLKANPAFGIITARSINTTVCMYCWLDRSEITCVCNPAILSQGDFTLRYEISKILGTNTKRRRPQKLVLHDAWTNQTMHIQGANAQDISYAHELLGLNTTEGATTRPRVDLR